MAYIFLYCQKANKQRKKENVLIKSSLELEPIIHTGKLLVFFLHGLI